MPSPSPPETHLDLDQFLCFAIHSTAQAVGRANKPMLDQIGLTYPQYLVMVVLWAEDNQTVGQIGDKLFLESNTLTPLLKRLQGGRLHRAQPLPRGRAAGPHPPHRSGPGLAGESPRPPPRMGGPRLRRRPRRRQGPQAADRRLAQPAGREPELTCRAAWLGPTGKARLVGITGVEGTLWSA